MLSGGEKAKLKNIVMAIKGEYPKILDILDKPKFEKNQNNVDELFACNKRVVIFLMRSSLVCKFCFKFS